MSKEIVMAGVRYNNIVYDGFNHGECFKKLPIDANMVDIEQGFITNDGEFVDRKKAFTIARKAHQLEYDYGIQKVLISEDIHINWLHKKDKTIADLEAKLAETTRKYQLIDDNYTRLSEKYDLLESGHELLLEENLKLEAKLAENDVYKLRIELAGADETIAQLKQQLTEKEKEIENLNNRILIAQLQAPKEQILNILGSQCIQYNPDQDKISFAVEQLEKVKELLYPELRFDYSLYLRAMHEIDNQIKQLKEKK